VEVEELEVSPRLVPPANARVSMVPPFLPADATARWLGMLLMATGLVAWIAVGFDVADIRLLGREAAGEAISTGEKQAYGITGGVLFAAQLALLTATSGLFLLWMYESRSNLRSLGVRKLDYTTAWAVGGWLVPGLNLARPYQVMREIWKASDPASMDRFEWKAAPTPSLLPLWWCAFLVFAGLESTAAAMTLSANEELAKFQVARGVSIFADASAAISASLAYFVVTKITEAQREKWQLREQALENGSDLTTA
jgi:hypothetical protein